MKWLIVAPLVLACFQEKQDDLAKWIEKLAGDNIAERDQAARHLESLDPAKAETLEKWATTDPEVRSRLDAAAKTLRWRATLARVFGPTKRATMKLKDETLESACKKLATALGEKIVIEGLDPAAKLSFEVTNATLWESLGILSDAAGGHVKYGLESIVLKKGRRVPLPVQNIEQFQVSVFQATRIDLWTPGELSEAKMLMLGVMYQRDLKPTRGWFGEGIKIDSIMDANGVSAKAEGRPSWGGSLMVASYSPFAVCEDAFILPGAAMPLAISGTVDLPFAITDKEVSIPLAKVTEKIPDGAHAYEIQSFSSTVAGTECVLHVDSTDKQAGGRNPELELAHRMQKETFRVVTKDGKETALQYHGGSTSLHRFSGPEIKDAVSIKFRWITEFHRVNFGWKLEGLRLP